MLLSVVPHWQTRGSRVWIDKSRGGLCVHLAKNLAVFLHVICQEVGFSFSEGALNLHKGIISSPFTVHLRQIAVRDLHQLHHRGSVLL